MHQIVKGDSMTLKMHTACSLPVNTAKTQHEWCVFEHQAVLKEGDPPEVILVGACPLQDVYRLGAGKTNSEWVKIYKNGGSVLVTVIATTDVKQEAFMFVSERVRQIKPTPICNERGYNLKHVTKSIKCLQNGHRYSSQQEAAIDLGIHPSSISRHLNGHASTAQGYTFVWANGDDD